VKTAEGVQLAPGEEPVDVLIQQRRRIIAANNANPDVDKVDLPEKLLYRLYVLLFVCAAPH
jgi:hypothetical protein